MARKKKQYDDDDGRVIAPMNVDGMPWYVAHKPEGSDSASTEKVTLTTEEKIAYSAGVFKAILLVTAVFVVAFALFILFCTNIWLR